MQSLSERGSLAFDVKGEEEAEVRPGNGMCSSSEHFIYLPGTAVKSPRERVQELALKTLFCMVSSSISRGSLLQKAALQSSTACNIRPC